MCLISGRYKIFTFFSCLCAIFLKSKPIESLKHILTLQTQGPKCTILFNNHIDLMIYSWTTLYTFEHFCFQRWKFAIFLKVCIDLNHCSMKIFSRNDNFMKQRTKSFTFIVVQHNCNSNTFFAIVLFGHYFTQRVVKKPKINVTLLFDQTLTTTQ